MIKTITMDNQIKDDWRVQLLEHVPYVALCVRKETNINKSRIFALDAENEKSVTPTLDRTTEIVLLALINFMEF